jgi:hypothetical protein
MHDQAHAAAGLDLGAQVETAQLRRIGLEEALDPVFAGSADSGGFDLDGVAMVDQSQ